MRLYEQILAARNGYVDMLSAGAISALGSRLAKAECFVMAEDVAVACSQVAMSKPSSILSALDLIRAPYDYTWIEWQPSLRQYNRENGKPMPKWVGCLLETSDKGSAGMMMLAWSHGEDVEMSPFGVLFDWDSTHTGYVLRKMPIAKSVIDEREAKYLATAQFNSVSRWGHLKNDPAEIEAYRKLCMHSEVYPVPFCVEFMLRVKQIGQLDSYLEDIAGELPYVEAFLLLLNSRNDVLVKEKQDLSRLNKARVKNRKQPLKEFTTTRLRLSRVQRNKANAMGLSHEAARLHMVRGHFKLRSSGVYWWSAHMRGGKLSVAPRREYEVL